jgi:hypothetical protein
MSFNNVREQIGYCGIWCGSCVVGNGTLRELTKRYEEIIQGYGLEGWAPSDFDFDEFQKGLTSIQEMPLCPGCLKGGGRDKCEIRLCATEKEINSCNKCDEIAKCKHSKILEVMRTGSLAAGLFVMTKKGEAGPQIAKWTRDLDKTWPSCILFQDPD